MKSSTIIIFVLAIVCSIDIRQVASDTVADQIDKMVSDVKKGIIEIGEYYKNKSTDANTELNELQSKNSEAITTVIHFGLIKVEAFLSSDQEHIVTCSKHLGNMEEHMLSSLEITLKKARDVISKQNPYESTIKAGYQLVQRLHSRNLLNRSKNGNVHPRQVISDLKSKVKKFRKTVNLKKSAIHKECSDAISNASKQIKESFESLKTFVESVETIVEGCHLLNALKRKVN